MELLKNSGEFDHMDAETGRAIAKLADMSKLLEANPALTVHTSNSCLKNSGCKERL